MVKYFKRQGKSLDFYVTPDQALDPSLLWEQGWPWPGASFLPVYLDTGLTRSSGWRRDENWREEDVLADVSLFIFIPFKLCIRLFPSLPFIWRFFIYQPVTLYNLQIGICNLKI